MSKYKKQYDNDKIICPYCGHSYRPMDAGGLDEEGEVEECEECGKKYHLWQEVSVEQYTKPDCELNGQEHEYREMALSGGRTHPFCIVCGEIKPLEKSK